MLAGNHGGEPQIAAHYMVDQRAYIPFGARRRIPQLIRPDAGDDIGRHAPSPAVEIPRIRHNAPLLHDGTSNARDTTARPRQRGRVSQQGNICRYHATDSCRADLQPAPGRGKTPRFHQT